MTTEKTPGTRYEYEMSAEQYATIIEACKPVPMIMLQCGTPTSRQENANRAWCALGDEMGFDGMTVEPSRDGERFFTAIAKEPVVHTHRKPYSTETFESPHADKDVAIAKLNETATKPFAKISYEITTIIRPVDADKASEVDNIRLTTSKSDYNDECELELQWTHHETETKRAERRLVITHEEFDIIAAAVMEARRINSKSA